MSEELKSKQKLYIYNGIDSQLEEIEDLADAKSYINDYIEDGDIHPDIESIIILQQVGGVYVEETGEFAELNGNSVPVCKVDVLIDRSEIDELKVKLNNEILNSESLQRYWGYEKDNVKKLQSRINELEKASLELFNLAHNSEHIEDKIKANNLYEIIKPNS